MKRVERVFNAALLDGVAHSVPNGEEQAALTATAAFLRSEELHAAMRTAAMIAFAVEHSIHIAHQKLEGRPSQWLVAWKLHGVAASGDTLVDAMLAMCTEAKVVMPGEEQC